MSRVDVIIPCYRYGHFLKSCVESVVRQEGVEVRALIIDDGSPDNTFEVAAKLQEEHLCVDYIRHEMTRGHIATYNHGFEWVNGDYVLLLSADDLLTPGALCRAARLMDVHPEVGLTYGRDVVFETGPLPPYTGSVSGDCGYEILTYQRFLEISCALGHTPIQAPTVLVRASLHKKIGGYEADLPHTADTEIWLRLAANSAVGVLDAEQAFRRIHRQNMSFSYSSPQRLLEQKKAFDRHFQWCGNRFGDTDRMGRFLCDALAEKALWSASNALEQGDQDVCEEFYRLAVELNPAVRKWPLWSRLRMKRLLGPRLWSLVRATKERLNKLAFPGRTGP